MNQNNSTTTVKGYFVALGDERNSLRNLLEKNASLDTGRAGVFYKKEDLVSTLKSRKALKKVPMDIVEIAVPSCCIMDSPNPKNSDPNKEKPIKFRFTSGGKEIPIKHIQSFKEAVKEIELMMAEVA